MKRSYRVWIWMLIAACMVCGTSLGTAHAQRAQLEGPAVRALLSTETEQVIPVGGAVFLRITLANLSEDQQVTLPGGQPLHDAPAEIEVAHEDGPFQPVQLERLDHPGMLLTLGPAEVAQASLPMWIKWVPRGEESGWQPIFAEPGTYAVRIRFYHVQLAGGEQEQNGQLLTNPVRVRVKQELPEGLAPLHEELAPVIKSRLIVPPAERGRLEPWLDAESRQVATFAKWLLVRSYLAESTFKDRLEGDDPQAQQTLTELIDEHVVDLLGTGAAPTPFREDARTLVILRQLVERDEATARTLLWSAPYLSEVPRLSTLRNLLD
ncbi:MAG: hypothetical protein WD151_16890 [Phycisphaeraceae bacterium]